MIPATQPYRAVFLHTTEGADGNQHTHRTYKPVVAWNDDGDALIVGDKPHKGLVAARIYNNFEYVEEDQRTYMTAIPGGGWRLAWPSTDGNEWVEPIVAWAIDNSGNAVAVTVDGELMPDVLDIDSLRMEKQMPKILYPGEPHPTDVDRESGE